MPVIRRARKEGVRITAETCPHYLFFAAARSETAGPNTNARRRSAIRETIGSFGQPRQGEIDFIVSDHSPSPLEMKCLGWRRFLQSVGRDQLLAAWPSGDLDKNETREEFSSAADALDVQRPRSARGDRKAKQGRDFRGHVRRAPIWSSGIPRSASSVRPKMLQHRHKADAPYAESRAARRREGNIPSRRNDL